MSISKPSTGGKSKVANLSVSDYIQHRINGASESGYNSTKVWIKADNLAEADELLATGGFDVEVLVREPSGNTQYLIKW